MGGGDGRLAALHGGNAHFQLGQVGVKVEELDILVQAALLVVDGDLLVGGGPGDAVLKGVPVVIAVVDADVIQQAQLLPHGQDLLGVGGQIAVHLACVVQGQLRNGLILAVHNLQRVGVVDIQGEGIGAGGLLPGICHRQHDLVGVLQIAFGHRAQNQRVGAGTAGGGALVNCLGSAVLRHPQDGEGGGLSGIIFQRPTDLHRALIVLQVEALGPGEHCGGGLGMYHNPRQGGKPDVLAGAIGMGHGHPHGVGGGFPSGETVQHVLRDQDAVLVLGGGVGLDRRFAFKVRFRFIIAIEHLNGVLEVRNILKDGRVGAPQHGGGGVLPHHDGGGPLRDYQGNGFARNDRISFGIPGFIVAVILRRAVVSGEGEGHLSHLPPRQGDFAGVVVFRGDGGDVRVAAGPSTALAAGRSGAVGAVHRGFQGGADGIRQGELVVSPAVIRDRHGGSLHKGGHGKAVLQGRVVGQVHPIRGFPGALVGLEGDGVGHFVVLGRHGEGLGGEGVVLVHIDLLDRDHLSVPIGDHRLEGHFFGLAAGGLVIIGALVLIRNFLRQSDSHGGLAVFIGGAEAGGSVPHPGALQGGTSSGLAVDLRRIAEDIRDAGERGDGHLSAVHLLHRVPEHQLVARLAHMEVIGGKGLAADLDAGAVADIHQLVKGEHHRHQLAGAVGAGRGGGGFQGGGFSVVYQLHRGVFKHSVNVCRPAILNPRNIYAVSHLQLFWYGIRSQLGRGVELQGCFPAAIIDATDVGKWRE